jgi:hypothetical protein
MGRLRKSGTSNSLGAGGVVGHTPLNNAAAAAAAVGFSAKPSVHARLFPRETSWRHHRGQLTVEATIHAHPVATATTAPRTGRVGGATASFGVHVQVFACSSDPRTPVPTTADIAAAAAVCPATAAVAWTAHFRLVGFMREGLPLDPVDIVRARSGRFAVRTAIGEGDALLPLRWELQGGFNVVGVLVQSVGGGLA